MKEKTKNDIKEWFQMLGLAAAGGIVVFHVNSFFKPADASTNDNAQTGIERVVETVDSIIPGDSITAMNKVRAAREMFFDGMRRGLPVR